LATVGWKAEEPPRVNEMAGQLQQYKENFSSSLKSAFQLWKGCLKNPKTCLKNWIDPTPHLYRPVSQLLGENVPLLKRDGKHTTVVGMEKIPWCKRQGYINYKEKHSQKTVVPGNCCTSLQWAMHQTK